MRARALLLLLLTLLAAACGAQVTIRSPIRVRLGRPTATLTPVFVAVLPAPATPVPSPVLPTATPSPPSPTLRPSPTDMASATATAAPTTVKTTASAMPSHTASPSTGATPAEATRVPTPPPRRPAAAGDYAVRLLQLRCSAHGEFVQLVNRGPDQNLSGWRLTGADADRAFVFPDGYVLRRGETVTVHSGSDDAPSGPGHLLWTGERMWQHLPQEVLLRDAEGKLVDRWPRQ